MNPDLMHPASERSAEDHAGLPVVVHPLELGPTFFALRGHVQKKLLMSLSLFLKVTKLRNILFPEKI